MKKLIIACCAAALALGLVACGGEETKHCYKITSIYNLEGETYTDVGYMWDSKDVMEAYKKYKIEEAQKIGATNILVKYERSSEPTQQECLHLAR